MKHSCSMYQPLRSVLCLALAVVLVSCGGGGGGGGPAVTSLAASGMAYTRAMTVTVNGSGLADPDLFMTVEGAPCINVTRAANPTDFQTSFSCTVQGVGAISPRIRKANGDELARLSTTVPLPQVSMAVRQGARSGIMVVEIDPGVAPVTALNFMTYANAGYYLGAGALAQVGQHVGGIGYGGRMAEAGHAALVAIGPLFE